MNVYIMLPRSLDCPLPRGTCFLAGSNVVLQELSGALVVPAALHLPGAGRHPPHLRLHLSAAASSLRYSSGRPGLPGAAAPKPAAATLHTEAAAAGDDAACAAPAARVISSRREGPRACRLRSLAGGALLEAGLLEVAAADLRVGWGEWEASGT